MKVLSETSNEVTLHYWQGTDVIAQSDGTNTKLFVYDRSDSVRQLTDTSSSVGLVQTLDPYGNSYAIADSAATNLGFTSDKTNQR